MTDHVILAVVTAGLSEDSTTTRLGEAIAKAASGAVEHAGQHVEMRVVQLRDLAHGLTDMMITHVASPAVQDAIDTVLTADGLVAASLGTVVLAGSPAGAPGSLDDDAARPGLRREVKDEFSDVPDFASLLASVGS